MKGTIILVDDHRPDLVYANIQLRRATQRRSLEVEVVQLPSAREAIAWFERHEDLPPRCVLVTDINMPGMDGFELIATVRRLCDARGWAPPPVYVASSSRRGALLPSVAVQPDIAEWFTKPMTPEHAETLLQAVTP